MHELSRIDPFGARSSLGSGFPDIYRVSTLSGATGDAVLPITVRILLENLLRHAGGGIVAPDDVETLASWRPDDAAGRYQRASRTSRVGRRRRSRTATRQRASR